MPWELRMTLTISGFLIIAYIYMGIRLTNSFSTLLPQYSRIFKYAIIISIFLVNLLPVTILIYRFTGGINNFFIFNTNLTTSDYIILFPFWLSLVAAFETFPYFLTTDLIQLMIYKFKIKSYENWTQYLAFIKIGLVSFFLIYACIRSYIDTNSVKISSFEISIPGMPESLRDLSLVLTSDIHVDRYTQESKLSVMQEKIKECDPDLIFFAGDLVSRGTRYIPQGIENLCKIEANIERIACMGDHDWWSASQRIPDELRSCNWQFLNDQHHIIDYKGAKLLVTGITYIYSRKISLPRLETLLANAPDADLKIILVHQPANSVLKSAKKYGYHLLLAGHTHGGQIVFRPFGFELTPTQSENNYYNGQNILGNLNVFISNGIGLTLVPLRYQAPAEIIQISLK